MATLPRLAQPAPTPLLEVIKPLLSVPQAAKILGISQCTLRNWIQRKKIARVKVGGPGDVSSRYHPGIYCVQHSSRLGLSHACLQASPKSLLLF